MRPRIWKDNAAKQAAYRERKRSAATIVEHPKRPTIAELKELIANPPKREEEAPVKPLVFRNDFGGVITEKQWERLQERKRQAKEGGYELDEYSQ